MYNIYVHIFPDGRKYVGSTKKQNPNGRWKGGSGYRKHHKTFFNEIKSVGWNNIQHQIIETVEDKKTALKREEYYTLLWRTNEPEFGFNINAGNKPNNEIKQKISESNKGKTHSEESRRKNSESHKGKTPWNKGRKLQTFTEEHRAKISSALKGHVSPNKGTKLVMVDGRRTYVKKTEE